MFYQGPPGLMVDLAPPSPNGVDVLYSHEYVAARMQTNPYAYANNNPLRFVDPSGLACEYADPPTNLVPAEDRYFPWQVWRPQPRNGYVLRIGRVSPQVFNGVKCDDCDMDIEIRARSYRYYRYKNNRFIGHLGTPIGVSNDPRDFFGLVVLTVCKTNIMCCGEKKPDIREVVVSEPLSRDSVGVFIRVPHGIEPAADRFTSDDPCNFAINAVSYIQSNVREGPIDPNQF